VEILIRGQNTNQQMHQGKGTIGETRRY
jgi:hypothetical protein